MGAAGGVCEAVRTEAEPRLRYASRTVLTEADLQACQRLRAQVYVDAGYLGSDDLTDGRDIDCFDLVSTHGATYRPGTGELAGTVRIIRDGSLELPVESIFGLRPERRSAEVSRLITHPDHRGADALVSLVDWAIAELALQGVEHVYATVEARLVRTLQQLGLPFEVVGSEQWTYGSINVPIHAEVDAMLPGVVRADAGRRLQLAPMMRHSRMLFA